MLNCSLFRYYPQFQVYCPRRQNLALPFLRRHRRHLRPSPSLPQAEQLDLLSSVARVLFSLVNTVQEAPVMDVPRPFSCT